MTASDALDDRRDAHAAADAQRDEAGRLVAPLELVEDGAEQHRAGGAERVAEGDRAAVDVDASRGMPRSRMIFSGTTAKASLISQRSMSLDRHAGLLERPLATPAGRGQHDHRLGAGGRGRDDARARLEAVRLHVALGGEQHRRGAVDDAATSCRRCGRASICSTSG